MACGSSYNGKTKGILGEKKKKHFKSLTNNIYSGISNHTLKQNHNIDWDNFEIINTASNELTLTTKESFHIKSETPLMNDNCELTNITSY